MILLNKLFIRKKLSLYSDFITLANRNRNKFQTFKTMISCFFKQDMNGSELWRHPVRTISPQYYVTLKRLISNQGSIWNLKTLSVLIQLRKESFNHDPKKSFTGKANLCATWDAAKLKFQKKKENKNVAHH